jgi:hypothetical protein
MSSNNNYDDLDVPNVSPIDKGLNLPQTVEDALEIIKIGSRVKDVIVKQTERDTAGYLLGILKAVVHEQMDAGLIDREEGVYILDAIFDSCLRRGWVD